jgi:hypothetical protein
VTEKRTTESSENLPPRKMCSHPGCTRLTIRSKTGYCELHKSDANTRKAPLSEKELRERQVDDRWELHHGETDVVACRRCGKRLERLGPKGRDSGHLLREHRLTVAQYRQYCQSQGWGAPPITSLRNQEAIAKWRRDHPEKIKALQIRKNAKDKVRRATDANFVKHEGDLIRKRAQRKLTEDERKMRVQCQVPVPGSGLPCGEWYRGLGKHLWSVHHMSVAAYNILCPGAPTEAPDLLGQGSKVGQFNKRWWEEQKQKLAEAERVLALGLHKSRKKPEAEKHPVQVADAVNAVIPRFAKLIPLRRKQTKELIALGLSSNEAEALRMPGSRTAKTAARYFISLETGLPFDTVAQYHKRSPIAHPPGTKVDVPA